MTDTHAAIANNLIEGVKYNADSQIIDQMTDDELESFPHSVTGARMVDRVAHIYERSHVAKWLYEVMGGERDKIWAVIDDLQNQMFSQTVTWGIDYQEDKYSIRHNYRLTLEERRARLYRKKNRRHGIAPGWLEQYFKDAWNITVDLDETYGQGVFKVELLDDPEQHLWDMIGDLYTMKPSHLSYVIVYLIKSTGTAEYHGTATHYAPTTWVPQPQELGNASADDSGFCVAGWLTRHKRVVVGGRFPPFHERHLAAIGVVNRRKSVSLSSNRPN